MELIAIASAAGLSNKLKDFLSKIGFYFNFTYNQPNPQNPSEKVINTLSINDCEKTDGSYLHVKSSALYIRLTHIPGATEYRQRVHISLL